jgi:hypothetical protein
LRVAWRRGLEQALRKNPDSVAPYNLLPEVVREVKSVVVERLRLFNGIPETARDSLQPTQI